MGFEYLYNIKEGACNEGDSEKSTLSALSPKTNIVRGWNLFIVLTSLVSFSLIMFQVFFSDSLEIVYTISYCLDLTYLAYIISCFYIGYEENGVVITDITQIRIRYLRTWFIADVCSGLPWEMLRYVDPALHLLSLIRGLRILRLFTIIASFSKEPDTNKIHVAALNSFCILTVCIQLCACLWYKAVCVGVHGSQKRNCKKDFNWLQLIPEVSSNLTAVSDMDLFGYAIYWSTITIYVERVLRGELPDPKTKSFETVKNSTKDCLFIPKVMIFNSIAREITPFLTLYQTDKPMLPFLSEDMLQLMKGAWRHQKMSLVQMKRMLHHLVEANHIEESICDDVLREFANFCDFAALQATFREFNPKTDRVDTPLYETMGSSKSFANVWHVVKMLLVLSHGQARVERGFSINKELIVENQKEASLIAQRLIVGHVRSVGGVTNVAITKELLLSVAGARQRYHSFLDDQKRASVKEIGVQKRKALGDELDELKKKRNRVKEDIGALEKSADDFADKAESTGNLTFIAKSNSLRRTAKDKRASLEEIEKKIDQKVAEMKEK
ncbi:hypothetical protein ACEWY4_009122 [Coilia grayii]|uniref:Ion transport domain-containing protein n=1 Tax=Coilia grayii TaxID=363190 RepID=A0ABD1K5J2_9TELE